MPAFLVETALLTHGLVSLSNAALAEAWPASDLSLAWVDRGRVCIGGLEEYLPFRSRAAALSRIDCQGLPDAREAGLSGALTASGTMAVCAQHGIPLAVSCGIGGIGEVRGEALCPDLPALRELPVVLLATAIKDMLDIPETIRWLRDEGVRVLGVGGSSCSGYLFRGAETALDGSLEGDALPQRGSGLLLLNPIPAAQRIADSGCLAQGIAEGRQAEAEGRYYHPAANAAFDRLTGGYSSRIQLQSLLANAALAARLTAAYP